MDRVRPFKNITYLPHPKNFLKGAFASSLIYANNLAPFFECLFDIGAAASTAGDAPKAILQSLR